MKWSAVSQTAEMSTIINVGDCPCPTLNEDHPLVQLKLTWFQIQVWIETGQEQMYHSVTPWQRCQQDKMMKFTLMWINLSAANFTFR